MMKRFVLFLDEQAKKTKKHLTGHLQHLADYLFYGEKKTATKEGLDVNPDRAIEHLELMHHRFKKGRTKKGHQASLKIDGGMSVAAGMDHNGNHFVGYKGINGSEHPNAFKSEEHIHEYAKANNKPHFVREMIPLLRHVKQMKLKPGEAFQGDIVHNADTHQGHAQPNTIKYNMRRGINLSLAIHSQHKLDKDGKFVKQTNYADTERFSGPGRHMPNLAMDERVKLDLHKDRDAAIQHHIKQAKKALSPQTKQFAKSILHGDTTHKKFFEFLQQYSNHEARTSGRRDVNRMRKHVDTYMGKSAQKKLSSERQDSLRQGLHDAINKNEHHFNNLFAAHNHINDANDHLLDQLQQHHDQFDYEIHPDSPYKSHEGIVSSKKEKAREVQAKITRQGKSGFSKANKDNEEIRFGSKQQ